MVRLFATSLLLLAVSLPAVSPAAVAGPTQPSRARDTAPRQQRYWLSQDFQRLVFWQAPTPQNGTRR